MKTHAPTNDANAEGKSLFQRMENSLFKTLATFKGYMTFSFV